MPRPPRLSLPGLFYHVMARGNNKQRIFFSPGDCETYLDLLSEALACFKFELHAYCLMPNHVHLLLHSKSGSISLMMTWLQSQYARWFNWKYQRIGHLFQGRFKSKPVYRERYLREVGRYIHNNPVKAGLARTPQEYRWSSMERYLEPSFAAPLVTTGTILALCGDTLKAFLDFTLASQGVVGKGDDSEWPQAVPWYEPRNSPPAEPLGTAEVQRLLEQVAEKFGIQASEMQSSVKQVRLFLPKAVAMLALRKRLHLSLKETAALLGVKHMQSVENSLRRLHRRVANDPRLANVIRSLDLV